MSYPSEEIHERARQYLQTHPELINLDRNGQHSLTSIVLSGEMSLLVPGGKTEIGRPDLVLFDQYGQLYIVELQPTGGGKARAKKQLTRSQQHLQHYLRWNATKLYVTGSPNRGFKTEII